MSLIRELDDVGNVVVDVGPFLGESSIGLAQALARLGHHRTMVVAMDTWHERTGFVGKFQGEFSWECPEAIDISAWNRQEPSLLFWQFVRNVNGSGFGEKVIPFPVGSPEAESRITQLGMNATRPKLVLVNPTRRAVSLRHDLAAGWDLLRCGGTLAGSGYHLPTVRPAVDALAEHLRSAEGSALEVHVVHAPGALKWENISHPFSDLALISNTKSNFSTWAFKGKPCVEGGGAE